MQPERRRILRFRFSAPAQLLDETSGAHISTRVTDLSLNGCSLAVRQRLREGTPVRVEIATKAATFASQATIIYSNFAGEVGLIFHDVNPDATKVLHGWLVDAMQGRLPATD
jgi:PilZ domain